MLAPVAAVPFGDGQHFVQLAGGTNDRTAPKLLELGLIGNRQQVSKRSSLLQVFFSSSPATACFMDGSCATPPTAPLPVEFWAVLGLL